MEINSIRLKQKREAVPWSQEELAAAAGISVRTVQRAENEGLSSIQTYKALSAALNLAPEELHREEEIDVEKNQASNRRSKWAAMLIAALVFGILLWSGRYYFSVSKTDIDQEYVSTSKAAPVYPSLAAAQSIGGFCVVEFTITDQGIPIDLKIVDSDPAKLFDRSCIEAAEQNTYFPRVVNGEPVSVQGVKQKYTFVPQP